MLDVEGCLMCKYIQWLNDEYSCEKERLDFPRGCFEYVRVKFEGDKK